MKTIIKNTLKKYNWELKKVYPNNFPVEFTKQDVEILKYVNSKDITMIGIPRMIANVKAAKYVVENNIKGDFVECGVWRGGSTLLVKLIFEEYNHDSNVWLFDTFQGFTPPSEIDTNSISGTKAIEKFKLNQREDHNEWCYSPIEEVKKNFIDANVNMQQVKFIVGDVMKTIPENKDKIGDISFLRLDTDWYESTKTELVNLYPQITKNGFLIIDDYGHWKGSQKATDEYFLSFKNKPFMSIIDNSSRLIIKS